MNEFTDKNEQAFFDACGAIGVEPNAMVNTQKERYLVSEFLKNPLLGRPKGVLGKSRLDGKEEEIRVLLQKQVSKASIAKIVGVTRPTIYRFIKTRRLRPHP
jgi:hypothetical protein